jgi:hypothetical protein
MTPAVRFAAALLIALAASPASRAELATERYAPVQLRVAGHFLERARDAAARGDAALAAKLAWQASFDARLAWGMTESPHLRAEAAEIGGEANALIEELTRKP